MSHEDKGAIREQFNAIYRGIVRNSFDPNEKGMIQIEVLPMMKGIDIVDLPWAEPKWQMNRISIPQEGATVWVQFEGGNVYKPIYEAMALPIQKINDEDVDLDGDNEWKSTDAGDYAKAVVKADAAADAVGAGASPEYPYRDIFTSPSGIVVEIDDTPGARRIIIFHPVGAGVQIDEEKITVKHASGATIVIAASGAITVTSPSDVTVDSPSIKLGAGASGGVVTTEHICAFTGAPHAQGSSIVKAK